MDLKSHRGYQHKKAQSPSTPGIDRYRLRHALTCFLGRNFTTQIQCKPINTMTTGIGSGWSRSSCVRPMGWVYHLTASATAHVQRFFPQVGSHQPLDQSASISNTPNSQSATTARNGNRLWGDFNADAVITALSPSILPKLGQVWY